MTNLLISQVCGKLGLAQEAEALMRQAEELMRELRGEGLEVKEAPLWVALLDAHAKSECPLGVLGVKARMEAAGVGMSTETLGAIMNGLAGGAREGRQWADRCRALFDECVPACGFAHLPCRGLGQGVSAGRGYGGGSARGGEG
jgi:hypothetical protein